MTQQWKWELRNLVTLTSDLQESSLPSPVLSAKLPTFSLLLGCSWPVVRWEKSHIGLRVDTCVGVLAVAPMSISTWVSCLASVSLSYPSLGNGDNTTNFTFYWLVGRLNQILCAEVFFVLESIKQTLLIIFL